MNDSKVKIGLKKCVECGLNVSTTINEICVECYLNKVKL